MAQRISTKDFNGGTFDWSSANSITVYEVDSPFGDPKYQTMTPEQFVVYSRLSGVFKGCKIEMTYNIQYKGYDVIITKDDEYVAFRVDQQGKVIS